MMRSMFSGVSGLRVHQTRMDVIGNNIANVNTIGYKSQRVTFNEVFSQTLQSASSANDETGRGGLNPMQVGLGVNVSSIDMLMTQGAAQRTDNPFDLMINGEGFIVVGDAGGKYFTRAGALRQDDDGNLIIPNGMKVQGWTDVQPDPTTGGQKIVASEVKPIKLNDPAVQTTPPEATSTIKISGNLLPTADNYTTQVKFYDSLGNYYSVNATFAKDKPNVTPTASPWKVTYEGIATDAKGNKYTFSGFPGTPETVTFDTTGKIVLPSAKTINMGTPTLAATPAAAGPPAVAAGPTPPTATFSAITVDVSGLTQYQTNKQSDVSAKATTGKAPGKIMGYAVGPDGIITATYDNSDQRLIGQIAVAKFDNPEGLEKIGDNLYSATANSGEFNNIGSAGTFLAGVLEMSNVDLAKEFTEMIVTQRGFQANSRIITVSDEMLQELTNLKR